MVLDTHVHAWGQPSYNHPWVNGAVVKLVDGFTVSTVYTAEKLLTDMDAVGIDEAVVVSYPICDWTDNSYTCRVVEEHDRLRGIVMLDVFDPDAHETLREYMDIDGIEGFRLGVQYPNDHEKMWAEFNPASTWLRDAIEGAGEVWKAADETDALVEMFTHYSQLDQVYELVETYPELTYAIDHWAHADTDDPPGSGSFSGLADLADFENVAIKISETPYISEETHPYEDVHDHLRWLLEVFGRERVIWGSDYPNVSNPQFGDATYHDALHWLDCVDGLSKTDRHWLTEKAFNQHLQS